MVPLNAMKSRAFMMTAIVLSVLTLCRFNSHTNTLAGSQDYSKRNIHQADFTQAEMMLSLLRSSANGTVAPQMIESVLNAHGSSLIISQQNISRTVTRDQYGKLLLALNREELPDIVPVDSSERSRRGVEGLRKDVWSALRWGRTNTQLLAERIEEIKRLDLSRNSKALATRFLPASVDLSPRLYVVMGGRAGAAALEGDEIYFDVLATSYRAANGALQYPTPSGIAEYFAHEMHHMGLSQILNRTRGNLRLNNQEQRAYSFLTALVMEGSASYMINGHRSLEVMRREPQFTESLNKGDELLKLGEQVLRSVLENNLSDEAYEKSVTPFLGSGWHSAGAIMFASIDRAGGLKAVMKVLRDPRKLLLTYNQSIKKLKSNSERPPFDTRLAERISSMGE